MISTVIGDIDGDGYADLVVGAPTSDGNNGRVYIFFGHPNFLNNPYLRWVGIRPPVPLNSGGEFGTDVVLEDLNGDGVLELIVTVPERLKAPPNPGLAYIYDGYTVRGLSTGTSQGVTADQTVAGPLNSMPDGGWFGWNVFALGDVGGTDYGSTQYVSNGDFAIHAEGAEGTDAAGQPVIMALPAFVWVRGLLRAVSPRSVQADSPRPLAAPSEGKPWRNRELQLTKARGNRRGRSLPSSSELPSSSLESGNVRLRYPHESLKSPLFGAFILGAKYNNAFPAAQFMVSARERDIPNQSGVRQVGAGQTYTFHIPSGP